MRVGEFIASAATSPLANLADRPPWEWTWRSSDIVRELLSSLGQGYRREGEAVIHVTATVEPGAVLKGLAIVGPHSFISGSALVRGGCWLDEHCTLGPAVELKSSFMFAGSKLAHLNFVGDSVIGADVNIEAGAMVANYRNEKADKRIRFHHRGQLIDTGVDKFGALLGDHVRIGANAVIAPGATLVPGSIVPRLGLVDQS